MKSKSYELKAFSPPNIDHNIIEEELVYKCKPKMAEVFERMNYISCFKFDLLEEKFTPDVIQSFKNLFVIKKVKPMRSII